VSSNPEHDRTFQIILCAVGGVVSVGLTIALTVLGVVGANQGNNAGGLFLFAAFFLAGSVFAIARFVSLRARRHGQDHYTH
jgi:hypothetical protein